MSLLPSPFLTTIHVGTTVQFFLISFTRKRNADANIQEAATDSSEVKAATKKSVDRNVKVASDVEQEQVTLTFLLSILEWTY